MHIVFYRQKKSFLIIEMKLRYCILIQKNTEKTILLYIIITVNRGTYLGIDQRLRCKFVRSVANTWKNRMFDIDFVIYLCFVFAFLAWSNFIIIVKTTTFPKIKLWSIISRCKCYNTRVTRTEMTFAQNQSNFSLNIKL